LAWPSRRIADPRSMESDVLSIGLALASFGALWLLVLGLERV
jgi:hypothetical protein